MAGVLERVRGEVSRRSITSVDDYAKTVSQFVYNGIAYGGAYPYGSGIQQTLAGTTTEPIANDFVALAQRAYADNGPVFALMAVRLACFGGIRFQWQSFNQGRPSMLFGTPALSLLEEPWPGGTTQDLLAKMITNADLAGNAFITASEGELISLRPDWTFSVLEKRPNGLGFRRIGYMYREDGLAGTDDWQPLRVQDVAHFAPYPDPTATFRGMSWLTPVIRDLQGDKLMQTHHRKFIENGATPNLVISLDPAVSYEEFVRFKAEFGLEHRGLENAYKTLFLGAGADATVVGANFHEIDFSSVQGRGETRLAAAAGVPPTVVGFSEGLQGSTLNAGNFGQARRRLADITMAHLWANACGSLQRILTRPPGTNRLWYDARDVPFLREDAKDAAEVLSVKAGVIGSLIASGFTPESAKAAVLGEDFGLLDHTGLTSVQLQPPISPDAMSAIESGDTET
jgi:phage portal protein BeeE